MTPQPIAAPKAPQPKRPVRPPEGERLPEHEVVHQQMIDLLIEQGDA